MRKTLGEKRNTVATEKIKQRYQTEFSHVSFEPVQAIQHTKPTAKSSHVR